MPILVFLEVNGMCQDEMQDQVGHVYKMADEIKKAYEHQLRLEQDESALATC